MVINFEHETSYDKMFSGSASGTNEIFNMSKRNARRQGEEKSQIHHVVLPPWLQSFPHSNPALGSHGRSK